MRPTAKRKPLTKDEQRQLLGDERRRRLAEENLPLVENIAGQIKKKLPPEVERAELVAFGREGLLQAALRFDPTRGLQFSTYATYVIRGAILDGIRKMTHLTRAEYDKCRAAMRFQEGANSYLSDRAEDAPQDPAGEAQALEEMAVDLVAIYVTSLDALLEQGEDNEPEHQEQASPEEVALDEETRAIIR